MLEECAVILLLNGKSEKSIQFYCSHLFYLNITESYVVELYKFLEEFLSFWEIPLEWILEAQKQVLSSIEYKNSSDGTKKVVFLWAMLVFWNLPPYRVSPKWKEILPTYLKLLKSFLKQGNLELAMCVSFYFYHFFGNLAQTQEDWQEYNDKVVKVMEPYFREYAKNLPSPAKWNPKKKKIRLGILRERIVENSPFKVEYSLLKFLLSHKEFAESCEVFVISMQCIEKSPEDMQSIQELVKLGVSVALPAYALLEKESFLHSHLQKALMIRNYCLENGIDVLITTSYVDVANFLIASRSAPKQVFWSHGNMQYDSFGIDARISHCALKGRFPFFAFSVAMDKERYYNPPREKRQIEEERAKYPILKNTVVLGVIGRLVKVDSKEYLECIARVLHKYPNTIFIAAGNGNISKIRNDAERLGIAERFFTPGYVDAHIYGHIIDIFCNTFPLDQGESISEFLAKPRRMFVSLQSNYEENRESCFQDLERLAPMITKKYGKDKVREIREFIENLEVNDLCMRFDVAGYEKLLGMFIEKGWDYFLEIRKKREVFALLEECKREAAFNLFMDLIKT